MKVQSRRIHLVRWVALSLVLFAGLIYLPLEGKGWTGGARLPYGQQTFVFPNNEIEDAHDLHIEWKKAVRIVSSTPFKGVKGSGTGRTDLDGGTVAKEVGIAEITVDFDGDKPPTVLKWWWTKKDHSRLGDEKTGNPEAPKAPSAPVKTTLTTEDGTQTGTFETPAGKIKVTLPDDMRAGDTISGTVTAEPNGQTPEEKAKNRRELGNFMLMVPFKPVPPDPKAGAIPNILESGNLTGIVVVPNGPTRVGAGFYIQDPEPDQRPDTSEGVFVFTPLPPSSPPGVMVGPVPPPKPATQPQAPIKFDLRLYQLPNEDSPLGPCARSGALVTINEGCKPVSQLVFSPPTPEPIIVNEPPTPPVTFTVPMLGQNGRPVVITGPFDGNSSNTGVTVQPPSTQGITCPVIAESPRKAVFIAPPDITGPVQVTVKDGDKNTTAPFRNVGVNLTAPKTSLLKGERTTLTVQVTGLQGITTNVPLTLTCTGVITMQGGTYQPLVIQPSQVGADGSYKTTRDITGVQAGGWGATATVVTHPFDASLQDDRKPAVVILWNTATGQYMFTSVFPPPAPPVQPPQTGATLTGRGMPAMKGCIITLQHNAPDRRVFARLDTCTKSGEAAVETVTPKENFTIRDRNTADNTVGTGPK